jgi:hypothetical protein
LRRYLCRSSSLRDVLRAENLCIDSSGRANNWAMGFFSSAHELQEGRGLFHDGEAAGVRK